MSLWLPFNDLVLKSQNESSSLTRHYQVCISGLSRSRVKEFHRSKIHPPNGTNNWKTETKTPKYLPSWGKTKGIIAICKFLAVWTILSTKQRSQHIQSPTKVSGNITVLLPLSCEEANILLWKPLLQNRLQTIYTSQKGV